MSRGGNLIEPLADCTDRLALEQTADLGAGAIWTPLAPPPTTEGSQRTIKLNVAEQRRFFRLNLQ